MNRFNFILSIALAMGFSGCGSLYAQEEEPVGDQDGSSQKVEQRDESFRRQMELEDARSKDRTYVDTTYTEKIDQEKIDKLPEESRDNIRDQLVDVIMENGEWEPKDALEEYPYEPSVAAQSDPELKEQEEEAWDEQIQKYHEREAAAFGSHRGPVPGPGNPTGQEGGQQGEGSQGQQGQQGSGQGGPGGSEGEQADNTAGTYQPGAAGSEDETSTAGVSESALDFLRSGRTGRQQQTPASSTGAQTQAEAQAQAESEAAAQAQAQAEAQAAEAQAEAQAQQAENQSEQAAQESQEQVAEQSQQQTPEQEQSEQAEQQASQQDIQLDTRGIIPIQDLRKLEGTGGLPVPERPEDPEDSDDP